MQYIDLQGFETYLRSRGLVEEKHICHYSRWVLRFLRAEFDWKHLEPRDLLQLYSDQLCRDDSVAEWQLKQAMRAADLYLNVFLRDGGQKDHSGPIPERIFRCSDAPENAEPVWEECMVRMKDVLRLRHYSARTEKTYSGWVRRYYRYAKVHELQWENPDTVRAWLTYLATKEQVAASTQNQAFNSVLFLFREILRVEVPEIRAVRAKRGTKLPVVLSPEEVQRLLSVHSDTTGLMLKLTYGAGLRVSETIRLRIQDLDFENETILVRSGKGDKDRATVLPESLVGTLKEHLISVKKIHDTDLAAGYGAVWLPGALSRKYPGAPVEWKWQYVFPAANISLDKASGMSRRHHVSKQVLQRAIKQAARQAGIQKRATVHTLRHSFATHLLMAGTNIREVQELLGHASVETTMIYTHVVRSLCGKAKSPLDSL